MTPTGRKPQNQPIQVTWMCSVVRISASASRFGATPVRNIELVTQVVASAVHIR